jgi:hypothetical protein
MIELKMKVSEVDYDSLTELLLPAIFEQMGQSSDSPLWSKLLFSSQGLTEGAAKAVLKKMSKEKKDELLVKYINKNGAKIAELFMQMALSKGMKMTIDNVEASSN